MLLYFVGVLLSTYFWAAQENERLGVVSSFCLVFFCFLLPCPVLLFLYPLVFNFVIIVVVVVVVQVAAVEMLYHFS